MGFWLLIILLLLTGLSLWLRLLRYRDTAAAVETRASPLSLAVQELVATSGGIYLAIVALTSFLKLEMPDRVSLLTTTVDPLALTAIGIAIVQPVVIKIFNKILSR
jgi:hypothetical protein